MGVTNNLKTNAQTSTLWCVKSKKQKYYLSVTVLFDLIIFLILEKKYFSK